MKTKISSCRFNRSQAYPVFALQFALTVYGREAKDAEGLGSIHHVSDVRWMQGGCRGAGPVVNSVGLQSVHPPAG